MNPDLENELRQYAKELQGNGPVINRSHITLAHLWAKWGRDAVDQAIAEMPEFQQPCRKPYSIQ